MTKTGKKQNYTHFIFAYSHVSIAYPPTASEVSDFVAVFRRHFQIYPLLLSIRK